MVTKYIKTEKRHNLEQWIAMLYCISLPFRMINQFSFFNSMFGGCAEYLPFVFHVLGIFLWIYNENGHVSFDGKNELSSYAIGLMIYLNISSIIMAVIMQLLYGNHGSENAFQGILGMLIYYVQYLLMLLYNYRVFRLLTIQMIDKLLHIVCLILLVIGYVQIFVMNGIGAAIYDRLNFLGVLNSSQELPKLCLTGTEGASAGTLIGVLVLPFLFSHIIQGRRIYVFEVLLWLLPLYYTFSSNAYILTLVEISLLIIILVLRSRHPTEGIRTFFILVLCACLVYSVLWFSGFITDKTIDNINYLLFEKATDKNNGSTVSRTIPILVNWGAFKEYPILGVGNGLQGYFYEQYFPSWAVDVAGSDVGVFLARSKEGICNGGLFIPSIISGYGLVGTALVCVFVWKCMTEIRIMKNANPIYYLFYILSGISIIIAGFQGDFYGKYYIWFLMSFPFMTNGGKSEQNSLSIHREHKMYPRYIKVLKRN